MTAYTELGHLDGRAAAETRASIDRIRALFREAAAAAQRAGEIDAAQDVDAWADYLTAAMAGLRVLIKSGADCDRARGVAEQVLKGLR